MQEGRPSVKENRQRGKQKGTEGGPIGALTKTTVLYVVPRVDQARYRALFLLVKEEAVGHSVNRVAVSVASAVAGRLSSPARDMVRVLADAAAIPLDPSPAAVAGERSQRLVGRCPMLNSRGTCKTGEGGWTNGDAASQARLQDLL